MPIIPDTPALEDPRNLTDNIDDDMSPEDLLALQNELSMIMLQYTALSSIIKAISDCEEGIARNMA